ncbi:MAG: hypothetical protein J5633_02545 [Oscillospiraceae bacterium]|nr:hypothetical protein [Oscillospiraceae bacterium]
MATFTNSATLRYGGVTVTSNTVTGTLPDSLVLTKTPVAEDYSANDTVTYVLSLVNPGDTALTDLILTDDLGGYDFGTETLYPLTYEPDTLRLFVDGLLQAAPAVAPGPPMVISGVSVPAGGEALLVYETRVTEYAPLGETGEITNTVTVTGLPAPVTASATVTPEAAAELTIRKALEQAAEKQTGNITYTFTIENAGNTPAAAAENVILEDTFQPVLTDLTVTCSGTAWTQGTEYVYDETSGLFTTQPGAITVPAAAYTQDPDTGVWTVTPGMTVITVTGTI